MVLSIWCSSMGGNCHSLIAHGWREFARRGGDRGGLQWLRRMQTRGILLNRVMNGLDRQHHRKGATLPWRTFDGYRSSQQLCQLADDGKTESRPPEFSRVAPIGLVKGFKDMFL